MVILNSESGRKLQKMFEKLLSERSLIRLKMNMKIWQVMFNRHAESLTIRVGNEILEEADETD